MATKFRTAIHWFRRDLRLTDNVALHHACKQAGDVVPAYITSSWKRDHRWTGANRQQFLCGSLDSLANNIASAGGQLILRKGPADTAIRKLISDTKADALFFNRDPDPFGIAMEKRVTAIAREMGLEVFDFKDLVMHERDEALTGGGTPYRVFTPYCRAWHKLAKDAPVSRPRTLSTPPGIRTDPLPTLKKWGLSGEGDIPTPGEAAARKRLKTALENAVPTYAENRDTPAGITTSRLGADLRHGTLSIREVFKKADALATSTSDPSVRKSAQTFINELAWREFYMQILWHYPEVLENEFNPDYRGLWWDHDEENFRRWCEGETGFPIVDAGMRQLTATGFMHNRVRMIVSMFLTKDLHIDWRWGERYFMQKLVDGEIASNNGGWQWSAGTGADAAPYFRIQNPWTQTKRFDPQGHYIKEWIPELRDCDGKQFQTPPDALFPLSQNYPLPMVDHSTERERTLEVFKKHRAG